MVLHPPGVPKGAYDREIVLDGVTYRGNGVQLTYNGGSYENWYRVEPFERCMPGLSEKLADLWAKAEIEGRV